MAEDSVEEQFRRQMGRLETLVRALEGSADPALAKTREIVQDLLAVHDAALTRLMEHVAAAGPAGERIFDELAHDPLTSSILLLYGLHPVDLQTRVEKALESIRPALGTHGGNVELVDVTGEGQVRLRLRGNCHGCPSSRATLKGTVEEAILAAAPDVTEIEVENLEENVPPEDSGFVAATAVRFNGCPPPAKDKPEEALT